MKKKAGHRALIIQDRFKDVKFIMSALTEKYPEMRLVTFDNLLSAFHEIVYSEYDLVLIDCDIEGFRRFAGVKLIKAFNDKAPVIVTCTEENKFLGLRSVVEGADNYYIIRHDYQRMLHKIVEIALNLISPIDYITDYANDDTVDVYTGTLDMDSEDERL